MIKKIYIYGVLILGLLRAGVQAQGTNLYQMSFVPQQNNLNPAFHAPYDYYFGFPGMSGLYVQANNDAFAWNNLIERGVDDSLRLNVSKMVGRLHSQNIFGVNVEEEILRVGFKKGDNYFQVGFTSKVDANIVLTKQLMSFLLMGPGQYLGENYFKNNAIDIQTYAYLYTGWSRRVSEMVTVGARVKLISGMFSVSTKQLNLTWNVVNFGMEDPALSPYTYELRAEGEIRTNMMGQDLKWGGIDLSGLGRNWGFGVDLGVVVDFAPNWRFSGALTDLGAIFWKDENASVYRSRGESVNYAFQGLDELNLFGEGIRFDSLIRRSLNRIVDTLNFERDTNVNGYTTRLPSALTLGFDYTLFENHRFGLVFNGRLIRNYLAAEAALSYTYTPSKNFAVSVSNTFGNSGPFNLGFAIAGNLGPAQLHFGLDRINSFNVAKMRTAVLTFGINFVIGKHEILPSKIAYIKAEKAAEQNMTY